MGHITYCLMCLRTEVKMYSMNPIMTRIYNELISCPNKRNITHMYACYECAYLLQKYEKFKTKCYKAYNILCCVSPESLEVTEQFLKSIDRKQHKLETVLTSCTITHKYQPKQGYGSDEEFETEKVKSEPITFENEDKEFETEKAKSEPITFKNKLTNYEGDPLQMQGMQLDIKNTMENIIDYDHQLLDIKKCYQNNMLDDENGPEHDINDYQFTHTYQVENSNCKSDTSSMLWLTIESKENAVVCDNKPHLESQILLDENCFYNKNNNTELYTLENCIVTDNTQTGKKQFNIENECVDTNKPNETNCKVIDYVQIRKKKFNVEKEFDTNKSNETNYIVINNTETKNKKFNIGKACDTNKSNETNYKVIANRQIRKKELNIEKKIDADKSKNTNVRKKTDSKLNSKTSKDNIMTVIELTPDEIQREFLLRKKSSNYINNPYKCDLCYRGFISKNSYESHLKKHNLKYGALQCDICKLCYTTGTTLGKHRKMHKFKFSCNICTYVCSNQAQSNAHMLSHKGKEFTCVKCGMIYRYRNSLLSHMHMKHSVERVCEFCGSTFASEKGLACHKQIIHRQEKNEHLGPQCDECDVHFASELAWKRHRVLCSRHEVQFGCKICGDEFPNSESLKQHSRGHVEDIGHWTKQKYDVQTCVLCKRMLPNKVALKKHLWNEHPAQETSGLLKLVTYKYVCEFCGKAFIQLSTLALHQRKHSDEMPYSCPDCGMRTRYKETLTAHQKIHTGEDDDKFQCDLCGRPFSDKGRLIRHIKGHMGIRPFKCVACEKTFMFRCDERTHYKHVHGKVPYPKKNDDPKKKRKTKGLYAKIKILDYI